MELYTAIEERRSVRTYKPDPVPQASVDRILRAMRLAPTWKNVQGWHVIVVRERETIEKIGAMLRGNPQGADFHSLPMLMILAVDPEATERWDGKEFYMADAGIVGAHLLLAAQAEGLGTCWVGWFEDAPVKWLLGVPKNYRLPLITPLGYPAEQSEPRPRREIAELLHEEKW